MPWKKRNNKMYYYRSRRVDGRVVTEYLGRGRDAALISRADNIMAAAREQQQAPTPEEQELDKICEMVDRCDEYLKLLTQAVLVINGYHRHKGQWRKRRVKKTGTTPKAAA